MKKLMMAAMMLVGLCGLSIGAEGGPYIKAEAGFVGLGALSGPTVGMRGGTEFKGWDGSFGYTRDMGNLDSDKVQSNGATIHTIGVEIYRAIFQSDKASFRLGGGVGYSIVDLDGRDEAESDMSYQAGADANYNLNDHWQVGFAVKGFWLRSHVQRTDYGSHMEQLSNGQEVEVVDEFHHTDSLNLNGARMMISLAYRF